MKTQHRILFALLISSIAFVSYSFAQEREVVPPLDYRIPQMPELENIPVLDKEVELDVFFQQDATDVQDAEFIRETTEELKEALQEKRAESKQKTKGITQEWDELAESSVPVVLQLEPVPAAERVAPEVLEPEQEEGDDNNNDARQDLPALQRKTANLSEEEKKTIETLRKTARVYRSTQEKLEKIKEESLDLFEKETQNMLQLLTRKTYLLTRQQKEHEEEKDQDVHKESLRKRWEKEYRDTFESDKTFSFLPTMRFDDEAGRLTFSRLKEEKEAKEEKEDEKDQYTHQEDGPRSLEVRSTQEDRLRHFRDEIRRQKYENERQYEADEEDKEDKEDKGLSRQQRQKYQEARFEDIEEKLDRQLSKRLEEKKREVADDVEKIIEHSLKGEVPPHAIGSVLGSSLEEVAKEVEKQLGEPLPIPVSERSRRVVSRVTKQATEVQKDLVALSIEGWDALYRDSDGDGVSDYDEIYVFKTDPYNPHTAGSPLTDAQRILLGLDPHSTSTEQIPVESPKASGEVVPELFEVTTIEKKPEGLHIAGTALPNSFVTIFIYSTPIVVTVRADEQGRWYYTLKSELETGEHELYVATVNSAGRILAKSPKVPFTLTAEAVQFEPLVATVPETSPVDVLREHFIVTSLFALAVLLAVMVLFAGFLQMQRSENTMSPQHFGS